MSSAEHTHWIAGTRRPPGKPGGHGGPAGFELPPPVLGPGDPSRWPRAGAREASEAVGGAALGAREWAGLDVDSRRQELHGVVQELVRLDAGDSTLRDFLGLESGEWVVQRERLEAETEALLGGVPTEEWRAQQGRQDGGVTLVLCHWSDLLTGIGRHLLPELLAGRGVTLFSDERLPQAAESWARALSCSPLARGACSLLHGAGGEALAGVLEAPSVVGISGSVSAPRRVELERSAGGERRLALDVPSNRSWHLAPDVDPEEAAGQVVELFCGRSRTLSGQLPGQVARVHCPADRMSIFTEALLAELERSADAREPVPLVDRESVRRLKSRIELGLDEGATLIAGGDLCEGEAGRAPGGRRRAQPTVFTNVEPEMRIVGLRCPAPILCLLREPV